MKYPKVILIEANSQIEIDQTICSSIRDFFQIKMDCFLFCEKIQEGLIPEIKVLNPSAGFKVKEIEQFLSTNFLTSPNELGRVLIIKSMENMPPTVSNRLLKILEDGHPDQIYFYLTTNNLQLLLPTILSRCTEKIILGQRSSGHFYNKDFCDFFLKKTSMDNLADFDTALKNIDFDEQSSKLTLQQIHVNLISDITRSESKEEQRLLQKKLNLLQKHTELLRSSGHINFWKALFLVMIE